MKILFVTSRFPYPPLKGDKIRAYYPIKNLSQRHEIDLLSFAEEDISTEEMAEMQKYCNNIEVVRISKLTFNMKLAAAIFSTLPSQVYCYSSKRLRTKLDLMTSENNYDVVHIVCGRLAGLCRGLNGTTTLLDWIDALSLSINRMWQTERSWPKKLLYWWEWKKMASFEQKNMTLPGHSVITSPADQRILGDAAVEIIPNGVDCSKFAPQNVEKDIDLIFTGNMSYYPNVQAVDYFCREVFPLIRRFRPATNFYVVGINPAKAVLKWKGAPGVFVTGFVEDLIKELNRSHIFVAPLCSGAGIQNKILEALACELPVITTDYGNAGIQASDGEQILLRNSPESFAEAVLGLLGDDHKRKAMGPRGRDLVLKNYDWKFMASRLEEIYESIASDQRKSC